MYYFRIYAIILLLCSMVSIVGEPLIKHKERIAKEKHPGKGVILLTFNGYFAEIYLGRMSMLMSSGLNDLSKRDIQQRVCKYFEDYDVIITTDECIFYTFPVDHRVRCTITSSIIGWYFGGLSTFDQLCIGDTSTAMVSSSALDYSDREIADVIAHEVGHSLGLSHQSRWDTVKMGTFYISSSDTLIDIDSIKLVKTDEYSRGNAFIAPIMGISYESKEGVWTIGLNSKGELQDDTAIIAKTFRRLSTYEIDLRKTY